MSHVGWYVFHFLLFLADDRIFTSRGSGPLDKDKEGNKKDLEDGRRRRFRVGDISVDYQNACGNFVNLKMHADSVTQRYSKR